MAGFCVNCGAPLTGAFCGKCGTRAGSPGVAAPAPSAAPPASFQPSVQPFPSEGQSSFQPLVPTSQASAQLSSQPVSHPVPPAVAAKGSILGKVLLIAGGVVLLLFVIGIAGAVYGAYWVKHKVSTYAAAIKGQPSEDIKLVVSGNSCRLLPISDVQQVLGVLIQKSAEIEEGSVPGCAYYTNPDGFTKLQKMAAEQARRQTEEVNSRAGPKPDNLPGLLKETNEMEGIVKTLGLTQPSPDGRVFSFTVERNFGPSSWSGMRIAESAVPGFEEVPGVGDHAMIGSFGHAFYLLKGDAMIHMDTTWVPEARKRGSALGSKIMANL